MLGAVIGGVVAPGAFLTSLFGDVLERRRDGAVVLGIALLARAARSCPTGSRRSRGGSPTGCARRVGRTPTTTELPERRARAGARRRRSRFAGSACASAAWSRSTTCRSTVRPGRGRRADRAERRGQDDAHRRGDRVRRASTGEIRLDGVHVSTAGRRGVARGAGIGRSFQTLELFESLTVRENLRVASEPRDPLAYLTDLVWPRRAPLAPTRGRGGARVRARGRPRPPARGAAVRPPPARGDRACGGRRVRRCCCSTSPRPASTTTRPPSSAGSSAGSPTTGGSRCCWSSTTSGWCSTCATGSSCSTRAGTSPRAHPRRSATIPRSSPRTSASRSRSGTSRERPHAVPSVAATERPTSAVARRRGARRPATATSPRSATSTSRCAPARSSRCSARTARARRPRCSRSRASSRRSPARCGASGARRRAPLHRRVRRGLGFVPEERP